MGLRHSQTLVSQLTLTDKLACLHMAGEHTVKQHMSEEFGVSKYGYVRHFEQYKCFDLHQNSCYVSVIGTEL